MPAPFILSRPFFRFCSVSPGIDLFEESTPPVHPVSSRRVELVSKSVSKPAGAFARRRGAFQARGRRAAPLGHTLKTGTHLPEGGCARAGEGAPVPQKSGRGRTCGVLPLPRTSLCG